MSRVRYVGRYRRVHAPDLGREVEFGEEVLVENEDLVSRLLLQPDNWQLGEEVLVEEEVETQEDEEE